MRLLFFLLLTIFSCSTKKDILLIQDSTSTTNYDFEYKEIKIQPDDILRIKISSKTVDLTSLYKPENNNLRQSGNILSYQIEGFLVDPNGFVNIPGLEPVSLKNLTLNEAVIKIQNLLEKEAVLTNGKVDIKFLNNYFTVLGEVKNPGRYSFLENNMNIFQALGMAGDMTINGKRDDIKIISENGGKMIVNSIDLTSSKLLVSASFQILPGDIIIVNANTARVKNAGIVGNFGNLLTALSFILSSIILITNN